MTSSAPTITSHPKFRELSNDFFKPYPPYVLVNSRTDARAMLGAGCEADYLVVLDDEAPEGSKNLSSTDTNQYKERIGILVFVLPSSPFALDVSQSLGLLSTGGTMIGFSSSEVSKSWKDACTQWAKQEKVVDATGQEQDGAAIEWNESDHDGQVAWSVHKKTPEWAFC